IYTSESIRGKVAKFFKDHRQIAQKAMPYAKGSSLGKMTQNVKNILNKAHGTQTLQSLIRHSHSLLR
ncbi:hypothetical protein HID58_078839, partial [Brassica napus]